LWYGYNNVTYCSFETYNTCVPYNTYGPYHQMGANYTYGACETCETCGNFCAYGVCGTCVTYEDEKCGTIVADVVCGTYVTHVSYPQVVHTWMDLPNEYKHVFTIWSKIKIMSISNVQDFVILRAYE